MARPSDEELKQLYSEHDGVITHIARALKKPRNTVDTWYSQMGIRGKGRGGPKTREKIEREEALGPSIELPEFADDDISTREIINIMKRRYSKRFDAKQQRTWFPVKVNVKGPVGLAFMGDPHVDDDGCNWPLLDEHCRLLRENADYCFAVNIGDTENNWIGRLISKYADQETSKKTAHALTKWLLLESGVNWLCWLMGNHDMWGELTTIMREMNIKKVPMEDWDARFRLTFPNKQECRVFAAHNFEGHSMWNTLHGPMRAARTKSVAHLYVCGHHHNWALHQEELASREFTAWAVRTRGYKFIDHYAEVHGHMPQREGATILAVIDPDASCPSQFVQCFADLEHGIDYLKFKRRDL